MPIFIARNCTFYKNEAVGTSGLGGAIFVGSER
jgi:hypothetical protein